MKNIKEKQLLVNFAKALGQDVDPTLVKDVNEYNEIKANAVKSIKSSGLGELFEAFKELKNEKIEQPKQVVLEQEYPVPPSVDDLMVLLNEAKEEEREIEEILVEVAEETIKEIESLEDENLIDKASKLISEAPKNSFQQPDPIIVPDNLDAIRNKIKFLEQWISKVSTAGQGSGEVKFRYLDDIDRSSIGNTDQVLRWNPDPRSDKYGKFFFGQLSGDQGPIRSMLYDTNGYGANANVLPGLTEYNPIKDCLNIHHIDGSVGQVTLENYIRVYNNSSNTIPNGTLVQFGGVKDASYNGSNDHAPIAIRYMANVNTNPLYVIGVATTDIAANSFGRATTLGEVNNINTTGNVVNEVWNEGDLLYAHPIKDGYLTKVEPTAPNIVISVAAVLHSDSSNGSILVRPVLEHISPYGIFLSNTSQSASLTNTGYPVQLNNTRFARNVRLQGTSNIYASAPGLFDFEHSVQITSTNSSAKYVWVWGRKNGIDIENSARKVSLSVNGEAKVFSGNHIVSMRRDDRYQLMWATSDTTVTLFSPPAETFCPAIPSVRLIVTEVAQ